MKSRGQVAARQSSHIDPIKVYFDPQIFLAQERGGISRYFTELISTFQVNPELEVIPLFRKLPMRLNAHACEMFGMKPLRAGKLARAVLLGFYACLPTPRRANLIHSTFYFRPFLRRSKPLVSTLYDMLPERFGGQGNPHRSKRRFLEESSGVISISMTSLEELESIWGFLPAVTKVTHLGVSEAFALTSVQPNSSENPYLLAVGGRSGYKRGDLLIELAKHLAEDEKLLLIGPPLSEGEIAELKLTNSRGRIAQVVASDSELPRLYRGAKALVFPSDLEGFGLPILEALSSGTRVVAADNAVNREIAEGQLDFFAVGDTGGFVSVALEVLRSPPLDAQVISGRESFAQGFTWRRTAIETATFYKSVLSRSTAHEG